MPWRSKHTQEACRAEGVRSFPGPSEASISFASKCGETYDYSKLVRRIPRFPFKETSERVIVASSCIS